MGWLGLRISVFTAARQRKRVALLNIGNSFLRPIVAAGFVLLIAVSALWAMAGYLVATLGVVLAAERLYRGICSDTASSTLGEKYSVSGIGKNIISYSWPFAVWGIFGWIHMSCDRWALQAFHGAEVVGAFSVVSQLAVFPLIFGSGFLGTLFTPIAFQRAGDLAHRQNIISANKLLSAMTATYVVGVIILVFFFSVFHYPLVRLISNAQFAVFSFLLPWLTTAWGFFYLGQVLSVFGMLANRPQCYIAPKLVSAVVAGIGSFYMSASFGVVGVVWGLAAAGIIYALWCFIIAMIILQKVYFEPMS
jgi:O-antigen/teichoic acid export membrane protein